jgi:hypothetical protein
MHSSLDGRHSSTLSQADSVSLGHSVPAGAGASTSPGPSLCTTPDAPMTHIEFSYNSLTSFPPPSITLSLSYCPYCQLQLLLLNLTYRSGSTDYLFREFEKRKAPIEHFSLLAIFLPQSLTSRLRSRKIQTRKEDNEPNKTEIESRPREVSYRSIVFAG